VIDAICSRRSVRQGFTPATVAAEAIDDILRCGLAAPSSKNAQPWRLHVITDRHLNRDLAAAVAHAKGRDSYVPIDPRTGRPRQGMVSTVTESAAILEQAALAIYVESYFSFSGGREALANATAANRRSALVGFALDMIGIGATIENMWLAAESHGLSGVFMGDVMIAEETISRRLGIKGDLVGVLALGRSDRAEIPPKSLAEGRVVLHS
jgi:nitroreductase